MTFMIIYWFISKENLTGENFNRVFDLGIELYTSSLVVRLSGVNSWSKKNEFFIIWKILKLNLKSEFKILSETIEFIETIGFLKIFEHWKNNSQKM